MMYPLYGHGRQSKDWLGRGTRLALMWWQEVLQHNLSRKIDIVTQVEEEVVELFCDARGHPARIAAVVMCGGRIYYTDRQPPDEVMKKFRSRKEPNYGTGDAIDCARPIDIRAKQERQGLVG